jgi:hypothetical protein
MAIRFPFRCGFRTPPKCLQREKSRFPPAPCLLPYGKSNRRFGFSSRYLSNLAVADSRLPVPSLAGVFAISSCPTRIARAGDFSEWHFSRMFSQALASNHYIRITDTPLFPVARNTIRLRLGSVLNPLTQRLRTHAI